MRSASLAHGGVIGMGAGQRAQFGRATHRGGRDRPPPWCGSACCAGPWPAARARRRHRDRRGPTRQFIEQRVAAGEVALRFGIDHRVAQSGSEEKSDARLRQSPYLSGVVDQCAALCLTGPMGISHEHGPNPRRPLISNCTDRAGFCAASVSVCSDLSDPSSCKKPKKSPGLWWLGD